MVVYGESVKFDPSVIPKKRAGKTEIRKRMEALETGFSFTVSGDEVLNEMKKARYAASNIPRSDGVFSVIWIEREKVFCVVRVS